MWTPHVCTIAKVDFDSLQLLQHPPKDALEVRLPGDCRDSYHQEVDWNTSNPF